MYIAKTLVLTQLKYRNNTSDVVQGARPPPVYDPFYASSGSTGFDSRRSVAEVVIFFFFFSLRVRCLFPFLAHLGSNSLLH